MSFEKISLRPGVTVELTPTLNKAGYSQSQFVRFFAGQLQKLGGWTRLPGLDALKGTCRGLFAWADLVGNAYLAAGTEQRLCVITGGVSYDITPIVATSNLAPAIAATAGSQTFIITDASYTPKAGDTVNIVTPVSQGGLVLQGYYRITAQLATSAYAITAAIAATASQPSGGTVPKFTTTAGSALVTVAQPNHGLVVGSAFNVPVSTNVGGLTIFGFNVVSAVLDANTFRFAASALATSAATVSENGGQMRLLYLLPSGVASNYTASGWGAGDWGRGDWGKSSTGSTSLVTRARTWSLDHFGQDLIASPDMGAIYYWQPPAAAPALVLSPAAPTINRVVFAIAQAQIIMACGSSLNGVYGPTLIRWCDSGDFTSWMASATNQAGSYQLPSGSYVTAALAVGLGALIWTDVDLWSVTYQGLPYVFGFNRIAVECEALSKKAVAVIGAAVVWPSSRGFFRYDGGGVKPLPCPVFDFFFNNLNTQQLDLVCSAVNTLFNEVSWFFPTNPNSIAYVKWNFLDNVWDYGTLARTAWIDHSAYGNPVACDSYGILYTHEDSDDADGHPMVCYAQSGFYDIRDGSAIEYVNSMIPDFLAESGSTVIQITVLATDYPGQTPRTYGPFTVTTASRRINCSIRGRQIAFRIGSNGLGGWWRVGAMRYNPQPAGTRP